MKFLVESEFQGQEPPRTQETTKTTSTIRIPRVGFGTDRPYIALFGDRPSRTTRGANLPVKSEPPPTRPGEASDGQENRLLQYAEYYEPLGATGREGRSQKRAI